MRGGTVVLVIAAWAANALAQPAPEPAADGSAAPIVEGPPAPPPTPAEAAFLEGRALMDEGKPGEACAKFETSIKLDPEAPGTMLNLGLCNERLGRTATALHWFRRAQFRSSETGMADYEDVAKNHTFELAVRVPTIKIAFAYPPSTSARVYVDDEEISEIDYGKLEVNPSSHRIELREAGKPPIRLEITIKDGESQVVTIPVPAPVKSIIVIDHGKTQRRLAYVTGVAGALMWGGSLALSIVARDRHDATDNPDERWKWRNVARYGGTSLFVVGTAAVVGAAYLYMKAPGTERIERTAVTPVIGTDQLGVAVHGAF